MAKNPLGQKKRELSCHKTTPLLYLLSSLKFDKMENTFMQQI